MNQILLQVPAKLLGQEGLSLLHLLETIGTKALQDTYGLITTVMINLTRYNTSDSSPLRSNSNMTQL